MQIYALASLVLVAFATVQAGSIRKLQTSSTAVADWGDCTNARACKTATSSCIRFSQYYAQCLPATLPTGGLCGQADGTNDWKYPYCPSGQTCVAVGKDFHCRSPGSVTIPIETTVATWGDCTGGKTCTNPTSQCISHSQWYAQCKPATLPAGELCGQRNGATTLWLYSHCPTGQTCTVVAGSATDLRCQ